MPDSSYKTRIFRYRGSSMWPCLREGDVLVAREVSSHELRLGDCIVYRKPGEKNHLVHRIVAKKPFIRTRGDALSCVDSETVISRWIMGRVEVTLRGRRQLHTLGGKRGLLISKTSRWVSKTKAKWLPNSEIPPQLVKLFLKISEASAFRRFPQSLE